LTKISELNNRSHYSKPAGLKKDSINKPKLQHYRKLKVANFIFAILILILIAGNSFFIFNFTVEKKTPSQALSSIAKTGLKVVDSVWEPTLKRTDNYTAALIMGIDSRELKFDGKEFKGKDRDIDTMVQVVFNHDTGKVFLFSIPRDTGVLITEKCVNQAKQYFKSINHAYKFAEDGNCPEGGEKIMEKYVSSVTGFENHYFSIVSYDAFRLIVNTLGAELNGSKGLYIDVQKSFTDYYPREQGGGFERVSFKKGRQFIDSVQLLKFARVRKASSDFDRAQRQQQVLEALQEHVMGDSLLSDPVKIYELYQVFQKNALFSPINLDDIRGALNVMSKADTDNAQRYVLDDNFGGKNKLFTKPTFSNGKHNRPGYYLSPVAWNNKECIELKDEYCKVKQYIQKIFNLPAELQTEEAVIYAYPTINNKDLSAAEYVKSAKDFPVDISVSKTAVKFNQTFGDLQIFDFTNGEKPLTAERLKSAFQVELIAGSESPFKKAPNGEDFVIVVKSN